jgi:hypothetical protein
MEDGMAVNNEIPSMGSSEAAQAVVQNLGDKTKPLVERFNSEL